MDDPFAVYTAFLNETFRSAPNWEELKDQLTKLGVAVSEEDGKVIIAGTYQSLVEARRLLADGHVPLRDEHPEDDFVSKEVVNVTKSEGEAGSMGSQGDSEEESVVMAKENEQKLVTTDDKRHDFDRNSQTFNDYKVVLNPKFEYRWTQLAQCCNVSVKEIDEHATIHGTYEEMEKVRACLRDDHAHAGMVSSDESEKESLDDVSRGGAGGNHSMESGFQVVESAIDAAISTSTKIKIKKQDITKLKVDAIVNPVGEHVGCGGQLAQLIYDKAGPGYLKELQRLKENNFTLKEGDCRITGGYKLCKHVIHVRGPSSDWRSSMLVPSRQLSSLSFGLYESPAEVLERAVTSVLKIADMETDIETIAIPSISTGDSELSAKDLIPAILKAVVGYKTATLKKIYLVDVNEATVKVFKKEYDELCRGNTDETSLIKRALCTIRGGNRRVKSSKAPEKNLNDSTKFD